MSFAVAPSGVLITNFTNTEERLRWIFNVYFEAYYSEIATSVDSGAPARILWQMAPLFLSHQTSVNGDLSRK